MEIAQFNLIRSIRGTDDEDTLRLTEERIIQPYDEPAPDLVGCGAIFQRVLWWISSQRTNSDSERPQLTTALAQSSKPNVRLTLVELPGILGNADDDPLTTSHNLSDSTPLLRTYMILNILHKRLGERNDRVAGQEIGEMLDQLVKEYDVYPSVWATILEITADLSIPFQVALLGLRQSLTNAMRSEIPDFERAVKLTRLALIADLLNRSQVELRAFMEVDVSDVLNRRPVVLAGESADAIAPQAQIKLIRQAKAADLHVVRREWSCYTVGEIANIRNVMLGESFKQSDKTLHETDETNTSETERRDQTIKEDQSKEATEFSEAVSSELGVSVNGHFDGSATFSYPMVTATVSAGADVGLTIQRSEQHASKIAREVVSRAVSQIDKMSRASRTRRELMRTEQGFEYELKNTTDQHVHGVYRWVDRIDTYQVFRFSERFLLEFQIPEPAEFYRWRTGRQREQSEAVDKPPEWTLKANEILPDKLIELAALYHASNLPTVPAQSISVVRTIFLEIDKGSIPTSSSPVVWNSPAISKEVEIPIPPNYAATKVEYAGEGHPIRGVWRIEGFDNNLWKIGYHSTWATVVIGQYRHIFYSNVDVVGTPLPASEIEVWQSANGVYGGARLLIGRPNNIDETSPFDVPISPGAMDMMTIAVSAVGVLNCIVTFSVTCDLTTQAYSEWQLSVYDVLFSAWSQWKKDYATNQQRQTIMGVTSVDAGSSQRNEQIIREELKREVISWLLDKSDFAGLPALHPRAKDTAGKEIDFADINFDLTRQDAPTVQFMEQAFDWNNMSYVFYPYFWADRDGWENLSKIAANDPEFERFLRAGSARVIISARPGFTSAVQNWLIYKVPFMDGQLPAPDEELYVSIDKEIRELTAPSQGGIAEDTWESRVSTTLIYLETVGDLPFVNTDKQLPIKKGEPFAPSPMCGPTDKS